MLIYWGGNLSQDFPVYQVCPCKKHGRKNKYGKLEKKKNLEIGVPAEVHVLT